MVQGFDKIHGSDNGNEAQLHSNPDLQNLCLERGERRPIRIDTPADIQQVLRDNEERVAMIKSSIVDTFRNLPKDFKEQVLKSFPDNWTGEHYPLYDSLRTAC